jgi:hypothetical protein
VVAGIERFGRERISMRLKLTRGLSSILVVKALAMTGLAAMKGGA